MGKAGLACFCGAILLLLAGCSFQPIESQSVQEETVSKPVTTESEYADVSETSDMTGMPDRIGVESVRAGSKGSAVPERAEASYVGNRKSHVYHRKNCAGVKTMKAENKQFFHTREEAIKAGFSPCEKCRP